MQDHYRWAAEAALIIVVGALGLEEIPVLGAMFPIGGSHFVQAGFAVLLAVMMLYARAHFGLGEIGSEDQTRKGLVPVMPVAFRIAFVVDLMLLAIEEFVPVSHGILPLCGTHLWQLSGLMLFAYIWSEMWAIWRSC